MAAKIFLAHAREDKAQVRKLYAHLKARGFDLWLDEKDLRAGQIWKVEIPKAIREARLFLACLSSRSVGKIGYVQNEFRLALTAFGERPPGSIYLIPVRLDECEVPDLQIPDRGMSLQDIQWVDLWEEDGFDRLVSDLQHALGVATPPKAPREEAPTPIQPPKQKAEYRAEKKTGAEARPDVAKLPAGGEPKPRTVFRDINNELWCPEVVLISPGEFIMGSTEAEHEKPRHRVKIAAPFAAGRYPVTFEEYDRFAAEIGRGQSKDQNWGRGRRPAINVSWDDAKAYVAWLSKQTNQPYRLLSEAEWEYACRAGTTTRYWWGDDPPTPEQANFGRNADKTSEVGSYPAMRAAPQIFISYARDDDEPPPYEPNAKGFVTHLHGQLQYELKQFGQPRPVLWRDRKRIDRGDQFELGLIDALAKSSLLLVVLSRNWLDRDWCQKELDEFVKQFRTEDARTIRERIVVVGKNEVARTARPEWLQNQEGYNLFWVDPESREEVDFFVRGRIVDPRYLDRLRELARYLWKRAQERAPLPNGSPQLQEANPWGLYDMHGNVWEWVEDCWNESYQGAPSDGSAWTSGDCSRRVLRGGSWNNEPEDLRSARRGRNRTDSRDNDIGFRVARTLSRSES